MSTYAKVNLHLSVGELRPDGFHNLTTVFQAIDLSDEVFARSGAGGISLRIEGEGAADLPTDSSNLVHRAAHLLATTIGRPADVDLYLRKSIPVAAGLAGGSADAAGTLLALATLWGLDATATDLVPLAARLGSDCAFPLVGGTAVGTGRGEVVTSATDRTTLHWVLGVADFGISAGDAYRELDRLRAAAEAPGPSGEPVELLEALEVGDAERVAPHLRNDLQAAVLSLAPALTDTLAAGLGHGAMAAIVSGSGPTCAFLCDGPESVRRVGDGLRADGTCRLALEATNRTTGPELLRTDDPHPMDE